MNSFRRMLASICLFFGLFVAPAHAETYHTCGTVIASLPTVISTQGVYCLTHDLNTAITIGNAIDIQTNNVTIDCNGYKIGGLSAGTGSSAIGIRADNRQNITIRNCGIRGFSEGISLNSGAGHLVEDNRLDSNLYIGIRAQADNSTVRRNRIYDTGGAAAGSNTYAIAANADVIDNSVSGVVSTLANPLLLGIYVISTGNGVSVSGNRVSGLSVTGSGSGYGISVNVSGVSVKDNVISATASTNGDGIIGISSDTLCSGNLVHKFTTGISNCQDAGNNTSN